MNDNGKRSGADGAGQEKRRSGPRAATKIEIIFREAGSFARSYVLNISNGGVFIRTDRPLPLDSSITLSLQLPQDAEKIEIEGRVVWYNANSKKFPAGMGVQFVSLSSGHRQKIEDFVQHNLEVIKKSAVL